MNDNFPPWNGTIKYKRNYRRPTLRDFHCTVGTQFLKRFSCRLPWHLCDLAERGLWRRGDHWGFLSNKFTVGQVLLRGLHALSDQMLLQSLCSALSDQMLLQSLLSTVRPDASAASAQHCPTRCFCSLSLGVVRWRPESSGGGGICIQLYCRFSTGIPYLAAYTALNIVI